MPPESPTRRLLHRWFVEYNPLYLVSAMLVLGGTLLFSKGLAHEASVYGFLAVAAIAEVYSLALLGGAALLLRLGHRRSAVMLGLLTVLYQGDLTLHTETCVNLGTVGVVASGAWLALFVAKLHAAERIFDLRLSRATWSTALAGACGLVAMPYLLPSLDAAAQAGVVGLWLFALVTLQQLASVTETVPRDGWEHTVQRRSVRTTWLVWGVLAMLHVGFWSLHHRFALGMLLPVLPFAALRLVKREGSAYALVTAMLVLAAWRAPSGFAWCAAMASAAFAVRAYRVRVEPLVEVRLGVAIDGPYRAGRGEALAPVTTVVDQTAMIGRLLLASGVTLHLSLWTLAWRGGTWPAHVLLLDVAFTVIAALAIWRARARLVSVPLVATWTHAALVAGILPAPQTAMGWGVGAIGLGFVLLFASLGASWMLRGRPAAATVAPSAAPPDEH